MNSVETRSLERLRPLSTTLVCYIEQSIARYENWSQIAHHIESIALKAFIAYPVFCVLGPTLTGIVVSFTIIKAGWQILLDIDNPFLRSFCIYPVLLAPTGLCIGLALQINIIWVQKFLLASSFLPQILLASAIIMGELLFAKGASLAVEIYASRNIHILQEIINHEQQMTQDASHLPPTHIRQILRSLYKDCFLLPLCNGKISFLPTIVEQQLAQLGVAQV